LWESIRRAVNGELAIFLQVLGVAAGSDGLHVTAACRYFCL
jgi:hypothetical protein